MSSTTVSFSTTLLVGDQSVPLYSEVVVGDTNSQDGVENGFIFKLNLDSSNEPVSIYLGNVINFIETNLGGGNLSENSGMQLITDAFATIDSPINASNFNSENENPIDLYEFTINSTTSSFLFSINIDIEAADPSSGLISLPEELASWLNIECLSISFSASSKSSS